MVEWKDLSLKEQWSKKERFNFIMNYIDTVLGEDTEEEEEEETVETGTISVSVTDGENGVGNVDVTLSVTGTETTYTGKTGGAGGCTIKDVPYGDYDVSATAEGYEDYTGTFTVDGVTEDLNIVLTLATQDNGGEQ